MVSAGMVAAEANKGMGPDEESFNVTVPVTQKVRALHLHVLQVLSFFLFLDNDACLYKPLWSSQLK